MSKTHTKYKIIVLARTSEFSYRYRSQFGSGQAFHCINIQQSITVCTTTSLLSLNLISTRNTERNGITFRIKFLVKQKNCHIVLWTAQTSKPPNHSPIPDICSASSTQTQHTSLVTATQLRDQGSSGRQIRWLWKILTSGCFQHPFLSNLLKNCSARYVSDNGFLQKRWAQPMLCSHWRDGHNRWVVVLKVKL